MQYIAVNELRSGTEELCNDDATPLDPQPPEVPAAARRLAKRVGKVAKRVWRRIGSLILLKGAEYEGFVDGEWWRRRNRWLGDNQEMVCRS